MHRNDSVWSRPCHRLRPLLGLPVLLAALLLAGPVRVRDLLVEGRRVVREGQIATIDIGRVLEDQRRLARRLAG